MNRFFTTDFVPDSSHLSPAAMERRVFDKAKIDDLVLLNNISDIYEISDIYSL